MRNSIIVPVLLAAALPLGARAQTLPPLSTGQETTLTKHLVAEKPTVFVFLKPSSRLETTFLETLRREHPDRIGIRAIHLHTGTEPVARQYAITETPAAIVYDRRGRVVARSSEPDAIRAAITKAAGVMRIDWAEPGGPRYAEVTRLLGGRAPAPGILRTMSLQPEYLVYISELSRKAHFSEGFLSRRTKEMIATYVSALNKCRY